MDQLFITLTTGIANGAVYGLIGLGLVIIFRSTDVMNFAMASLSTLAIYVALSAYGAGVGIVVALVVAVAFGALSGVVVREALIRPLGQGKLFAALVVTMGLSIIVEHVIGQYWGEQPRRFPQLVDGTISIGNSNLMLQDLVTILLAALAVSAIAYLFTRTPVGSAMRAVAESAETAEIMGINAHKVARIAWALGMALAVLGVFLYAPKTGVSPVILAPVLFRAFAGILLGGLTSMYGAVIGGLVIGVLDNLAAAYISASFRDTFVFCVAVLVLLIRPQGIFGRQTFERV
ncbi:branched-chain amino acid ABC transporter permease [Rhodococcus opacus]|uniref:Putative ABC transporter permease protein n=1 Tax=Rhodococcus opacus (strain B4) TaxID=632772 RepID=C1BBQ6_RHOOB|nr:branched-chain amino acid ABC transporter permease [Rhodococcus opacus]BAH53109.1 putative ABC transporter permease protein [Rhodococcus opacus B4]